MRDPQFPKLFPNHQYLMAHLVEFRTWVSQNRVTPAEGYLTMEKIKEKIRLSFRGPAMGTKKTSPTSPWARFQSRASHRQLLYSTTSTPLRLQLFVPFLSFLLDRPDTFMVWFGDSTWIHANNPPRVGWRDEAYVHGNEDRRAQAGIGARVGTDPVGLAS